jgi:hypothetical protein
MVLLLAGADPSGLMFTITFACQHPTAVCVMGLHLTGALLWAAGVEDTGRV